MRAEGEDLQDIEATNRAFREEAARLGFHFGCGSCAHVLRENRVCSMGYPNQHLTDENAAIQPDGQVAFCKYWELGETIGWGRSNA